MESGNTATSKRNFSKYDLSGTDPNRYATVSNSTEAQSYLHRNNKSVVPGLRVNVSTTERILMLAAGSYLLYRAFRNSDKKTEHTEMFLHEQNDLRNNSGSNIQGSHREDRNSDFTVNNQNSGNWNTGNSYEDTTENTAGERQYNTGTYTITRKKNNTKKILAGVTGGALLFRGVTGYCPGYQALSSAKALKGGNVSITTSLSVNQPVSEVYQAWRQLENLPLFMTHLHSVMVIDQYTSQWKAKVPGGLGTVEWKAEILMDEPNQLISWHSLPGSTIDNSGKVKFVDNGSTTEIEATISYKAPLGAAGEAAAKWLNPVFENMVRNDIANFKQYIEQKSTTPQD